MKAKILLLVLLSPLLSIIQWSCCDPGGPYNYNRKINEIKIEINSKSDTVIKFSEVTLSLNIEDIFVANSYISNCAYACEPGENYNLINPLDSVSITINKNYGSIGAGQSVISYLRFEDSNEPIIDSEIIRLSNQNYNHLINFKLINPPNQTDTFQFTFVFKDIHDSLFVAKSKPIIISP